MTVNILKGSNRKEDAKKLLENRPILVLFYMDGCPHCEANQPAWDALKKEVDIPVLEIESSATPDDADVSGFPTMKYFDENGKEEKTTGSKKSADEIKKELKLPKKKKGGLRRFRRESRRVTNRRNRKFVNRSFRNNITFVK